MKSTLSNVLESDFGKTLLFGLLAALFSQANFYDPLNEGIVSNLIEIPLIISVFHFSNPLYLILLNALAAIPTPSSGSYLSTFLSHSVALIIIWIAFRQLAKLKPVLWQWVLLSFFGVVAYYYLLLLPSIIITNYLSGLNADNDFWNFYGQLAASTKFEFISTSLVVCLYVTQHQLRLQLKDHLDELEYTVARRTTFLNQALEDLKVAQQHLVQSEKMGSISTLTAGVAHEINNPLNIMAGGLKIIEQIRETPATKIEEITTEEEFNQALQMVEGGLKRCEELVQALISFSSEVKGAVQPYDIHKIIDITLRFMAPRTSSVVIIRDFDLENFLPIYPDKMHQVLANIFNNAFYAMEDNSVEHKVLTVSTYESRGFGMIKIHNTGRQIPEAHIGRVFDPFFTTKDPGQGKGLGLSIAYSLIVKEHSGKIEAQNDETGVSFTISIPL